jgi:hypothetical protein
MSSRKPLFQEELDHLIRRSLRAQVGRAEPSPQVWERIRAGLDPGQAASDRFRGFRLGMWPAMIAQAAVVLILVTVGSFTLQLPWARDQRRFDTWSSLDGTSQPATHTLAASDLGPRDISQLRALKNEETIPLQVPLLSAEDDGSMRPDRVPSTALPSDEVQLRALKAEISSERVPTLPLNWSGGRLDLVE